MNEEEFNAACSDLEKSLIFNLTGVSPFVAIVIMTSLYRQILRNCFELKPEIIESPGGKELDKLYKAIVITEEMFINSPMGRIGVCMSLLITLIL